MATAKGPVAARYLHLELERLCKERLRPLQRSASGSLQERAVPSPFGNHKFVSRSVLLITRLF